MCYLCPRQNWCSYLDRTPAVCSTEIANHKSSHDQNADNGISDIWCVSLIPLLWNSLTLFINSFCGFAPPWLRGVWICGFRRTSDWLICYSYKTCPDSMFITILPSRKGHWDVGLILIHEELQIIKKLFLWPHFQVPKFSWPTLCQSVW